MSVVVERLLNWASSRPEALACADKSEQLTYRELDGRSAQIAGALAAAGVRQGDIVALLLPRSAGFVAAALGVIRLGAAFVPLDPDYPVARLAYMVSDCEAVAVVCNDATSSTARLLSGGIRMLDLAADRAIIDAAAQMRAPADIQPHDGCYVIYTSGTTGRPKGVVIEHGNLDYLTEVHMETFGISPKSRSACFASPSFDASIIELWPFLRGGASVHIGPDLRFASAADIVRFIGAAGITHCFIPSMLVSIHLPAIAKEPAALSEMLTGGQEFFAFPHQRSFRLTNCYGPTEATVYVTKAEVSASADGTASLGVPIPGSAVYVLGPEGRTVAPGEAGEICIGGPSVARGYIGDPRTTAMRFVPDPFGGGGSGRMYRTGDLGAWRADGELEFRGRADRQVKIRGFRIELEEIESVLASLPEVRQAAVLVHQGSMDGEKELAAYVVPASKACTPASVRTHAARRLPSHMIPAAVHLIDRMPATPAGKTDHARLPQLVADAAQALDIPMAGDPVTDLVAELWRLVLSRDNIGLDDNFFEVKGDSLSAIRLGEMLQDNGYDISIQDIFDYATIRLQAARLRGEG